MHSLAELLHTDMIQQLGVALLGTPAAKILNILMMATKSQPSFTPLSSKLLCSATTPLVTTPSMIVVPPQVPIVEVTEVKEPPLAEAPTNKEMPSPSTQQIMKLVPPNPGGLYLCPFQLPPLTLVVWPPIYHPS